jgi:hypothetical protein
VSGINLSYVLQNPHVITDQRYNIMRKIIFKQKAQSWVVSAIMLVIPNVMTTDSKVTSGGQSGIWYNKSVFIYKIKKQTNN